jgi:ATP-dependent protease ClpP protease subunit
MAASIASIIALAGDEVIIGEGAFFMVHAPMSGVMGNAREMEDMIEVLDKIEAQMTGIYSRKTGLSSAEISTMLMKDTWLNAEEAVEMGFADRISDNDESQMRVAASLIENANWIKSRPNMKTRDAMAREKVKDFKNNIKEFLARK